MNRHLYLLLALGAASCEIPAPKGFYCGKTSLIVRDDELAGDVRLRVKMTQDDNEPGIASLGYSLDEGVTWYPATIEGQVTDLESDEEGVKADIVWNSAADLGKGVFENVSLRVAGFSECGLWNTDQVDELTIDNSEALDEGCTVEVETPDSPSDGPVVVNFTLSHPEGLDAYVAPRWTADGGETWAQLSIIAGDCDGDGVQDKLSGLSTSEDGVEHCLTWDSQLDLASDEDVTIELSCGVGYAEDSVASTDSFEIENDPAPGLDEVIITEIQPDYASSGDYVEFYNRTNHILNLYGVVVERYKGEITEGEEPTKSYTFDHPSGFVLLYPGEYLLLGETDDEGANGCIEPDEIYGSGFSLSADSQIHLVLDGDVIMALDFQEGSTRDATWFFDEDVALGIDPSKMTSNSWDSFDNWCSQSSSIETCEAYDDDLGLGTPGYENDPCP